MQKVGLPQLALVELREAGCFGREVKLLQAYHILSALFSLRLDQPRTPKDLQDWGAGEVILGSGFWLPAAGILLAPPRHNPGFSERRTLSICRLATQTSQDGTSDELSLIPVWPKSAEASASIARSASQTARCLSCSCMPAQVDMHENRQGRRETQALSEMEGMGTFLVHPLSVATGFLNQHLPRLLVQRLADPCRRCQHIEASRMPTSGGVPKPSTRILTQCTVLSYRGGYLCCLVSHTRHLLSGLVVLTRYYIVVQSIYSPNRQNKHHTITAEVATACRKRMESSKDFRPTLEHRQGSADSQACGCHGSSVQLVWKDSHNEASVGSGVRAGIGNLEGPLFRHLACCRCGFCVQVPIGLQSFSNL